MNGLESEFETGSASGDRRSVDASVPALALHRRPRGVAHVLEHLPEARYVISGKGEQGGETGWRMDRSMTSRRRLSARLSGEVGDERRQTHHKT